MTAVAVEALALVVLAATGWLLVPLDRGDGWRLVVALPLGIAAHACVELVLLLTRLPVAHPWVAAGAALVLALVVARRRDRGPDPSAPARSAAERTPREGTLREGTLREGTLRGSARRGGAAGGRSKAARPSRNRVLLLVAVAAAAAAVVLVTAVVPVVNVSADTFRYLTVSRLLVVDGDASRMSAFLLQSRSLVVGVLHGLALPDLGYLRAVGPLVAASTLGALWLLVRDGLDQVDPRTAGWVAATAAALLATNHRFLFNALYVNGHLLFAAWLLLLVAVAWRRVVHADAGSGGGASVVEQRGVEQGVRDGRVHARHTRHPQGPASWSGDALVAGILAVGLTVLRPEGALVAGLALAPVVLEPGVPRRWRQVVLVVFGTGTLAWHLGVVLPLPESDDAALLAMAGLGAATVLAAGPLPVLDRWSVRRGRLLLAQHLLLWLVVGILALRDASILVGTLKSIGRNVLSAGGWGVSLLVVGSLLVVALSVGRVVGERALLFPLLTFAPLAVLLNHARGGPGRVGPGDSLNRMLLHLLPLAVLALALAADGRPRAWLPWIRDRAATPETGPGSRGDGDQHAGVGSGGGELDA